MSKQSSIKWLVTELNQMIDYIPTNKWDAIADIVQQAKQMHKEEIEDAFCKGAFVMAHNDEIFPREEAEQYYQETYGGNYGSNN